MPQPNDYGYFQLALSGEEGEYPALGEVSLFLNDFNLLYELSRLVVDPEYADYRISRFSLYRNNKRLKPDDRLEIESLRVESPIALIAIVIAMPAATAALWALTQAVEKIWNLPVSREILKLQRDKLKREVEAIPAELKLRLPENEATLQEHIHYREAEYYFERVENHLSNNTVRVKELEITHVRELSGKDHPKAKVKH